MADSDRVLVLAAGSLGDALLTLPALRALRSRSSVTLAGTSPYLSLGTGLLGIERVLPLDPLLQTLFSDGPAPPRDFWREFQEVFVLFKERDRMIEGRLTDLTGKAPRSPAKPFGEFLKEARWAADYWLETVLPCPLSADSIFRQARLELDQGLLKRGKDLLDSLGISRPLVIHPGSGSKSKNAPLDLFRTAAQRAFLESGRQVLVIWGEAEEKELERIRKAFEGLAGVLMLDRILPLDLLASVLSHCAAYLGNDSGVTQLASAVGLRTFAVFGATDPRVWGPRQGIILESLKGLYR